MHHTGSVSSLLGNISFHSFKETHFCLFYQDFLFLSLICSLLLAFCYLIAHIVGTCWHQESCHLRQICAELAYYAQKTGNWKQAPLYYLERCRASAPTQRDAR